jgi:hypothetical protein
VASSDLELELAESLAAIYKRVCRVLQLDATDPLRAVAARNLIEIVASGERDTDLIFDRVINEVLPVE